MPCSPTQNGPLYIRFNHGNGETVFIKVKSQGSDLAGKIFSRKNRVSLELARNSSCISVDRMFLSVFHYTSPQ